MTARTLVVICCAGAMLVGCGGRNASPLPNVAGNLLESAGHAQTETPVKLVPGKSAKATLTIVVSIPRRTRPAPHYISPAARGMTLSFKGPEKLRATVGLTHSSDPHCKDANGVTTCTLTLQLSTGNYTANVAMFDHPPVNGHIPTAAKLLSTANNVPLTMQSGKANRLKFKPAGIVAALAISGVPRGTAGTAFASAQSFTVTAKDPGGFVIIGAYDNAVTLADGDTTGATTLATAGRDKPPARKLLSSSDTATLSYTGLAIVPATITASARSATNGTGTFTPTLQPIGPATLTGGVSINAYQAASPVTFSASEAGWTNSPYDHTLSATLSSACGTFVTVTPANGTTFTPELVASPVNGACTLTLADGVGQQLVIPLGYELFSYTGSAQTTTVPSGVTHIAVDAVGASGGKGCVFGAYTNAGGLGFELKATGITVTSGLTLYAYVGGSPVANSSVSCNSGGLPTVPAYAGGGFNGGGSVQAFTETAAGGGGGGASDVRTAVSDLTTRFIVAGGGGGGAVYTTTAHGGNGGYPSGAAGGYGYTGADPTSALSGQGGTSSAGGAGGLTPSGLDFASVCSGVQGSAGAGGSLTSCGTNDIGNGGGGGGYYGGGSGAVYVGENADSGDQGYAGGGGGSSFVVSGATVIVQQVATASQCDANNDGCITITW